MMEVEGNCCMALLWSWSVMLGHGKDITPVVWLSVRIE